MNQVEEIIERELEAFGVPRRHVRYDLNGGKHPKLVVRSFSNVEKFMPYSPRCSGRGLLNFRSDLRRFLELQGFRPNPKRKSVGTLGEVLLEAVKPKPEPKPEMKPETKKEPEVQTAMDADEIKRRQDDRLKQELREALKAAREKAEDTSTSQRKPEMTKSLDRSMLNHSEVAQITLIISQNATVDFETKTCRYKPSWNDERVLAMIAHGDRKHLTVESVRKLRIATFGRTPEEKEIAKAAQATGGMGAVWARIADLERRLDALEKHGSKSAHGTKHGTSDHPMNG